MANSELSRIIKLLKKSFEGPAWHGPATKEVIVKITANDALKKIGNGHTIAGLLYHMIAWRSYLIRHLSEENDYKVSDEENFSLFQKLSESEWEELKSKLEKNQKDLLEILSGKEDTVLTQKVGSGSLDFYTLIHGVIQHDLYHLGQIIMLFKHV